MVSNFCNHQITVNNRAKTSYLQTLVPWLSRHEGDYWDPTNKRRRKLKTKRDHQEPQESERLRSEISMSVEEGHTEVL